MAIHQIVEQNGRKVLVKVSASGGNSDEVWGKYVPGALPEDASSIVSNMPVGAYITDDVENSSPQPATQNFTPYNTEEWITESGTWTAPVTGWYDVWMISGGNGGVVEDSSTIIKLQSGSSGVERRFLSYFEAGVSVPVVIGSGGAGLVTNVGASLDEAVGGDTIFGTLRVTHAYDINEDNFEESSRDYLFKSNFMTNRKEMHLSGSGLGGGYSAVGIDGLSGSGRWYGGGGAAITASSHPNDIGGNGAQGAICLRYYDPNKENI